MKSTQRNNHAAQSCDILEALRLCSDALTDYVVMEYDPDHCFPLQVAYKAIAKADRNLIGAAPDLLGALKAIRSDLNTCSTMDESTWNKMEAAIAKAEGRQ